MSFLKLLAVRYSNSNSLSFKNCFYGGEIEQRTEEKGEQRIGGGKREEREKESEPKRGGTPRLLSGDFLFPR